MVKDKETAYYSVLDEIKSDKDYDPYDYIYDTIEKTKLESVELIEEDFDWENEDEQ